MRISDAVQEMSKLYLQRVIDSFTKDYPKISDEDKAREIILKNAAEMTAEERICRSIATDSSFSHQLLVSFTLESLLDQFDCSAGEETITADVTEMESSIVVAAAKTDALRFEDPRSLDILRAVLEVALEDEVVSSEELRLIRRLQEKLGVSERAKRILMSQLNHFPRSDNRLHSVSEVRDTLVELQRRGIVFYCNRLNGGTFAIPDELVPAVRKGIGVELSEGSFRRLLAELSGGMLAEILESEGLPKSGRKDERADRILEAGIQPSRALNNLSNEALYEICKALPGAKVSGTKSERIDRIVDYFANLISKQVSVEASPDEIAYRYLIELAHRDRENLLANKVITKDREMEGAFELGTSYLFREILGLKLLAMPGTEHPDGAFRFGKRGDLLMWDNKSKESEYTFPESHLKQFKRYIRDSPDRVSCFLVIVPEIGPGVEQSAMRLKFESDSDTDIGVITAEDLLHVAESWRKKGGGDFHAEVFNMTGVLDRQTLDKRMKIFNP